MPFSIPVRKFPRVKFSLSGDIYAKHPVTGAIQHVEPKAHGRLEKRERVKARKAARGPEIENLSGRARRLARARFDEAQREAATA